MADNIREKTGTSGRQARLQRIPLVSVTPLRRGDFMHHPGQSIQPGNDTSNQHVSYPTVNTTAQMPATIGEELTPVYAAAFHEKKAHNDSQKKKIHPTSAEVLNGQHLEDFPLPRYEAPEDRKLIIKPRNWFKVTGHLVTAVIAGVFLLSGFFAWHSYSRASAGFVEAAPSAAILSTANMSPDKLTKEGDARINVLLLGIGGEGHSGADLSDTMVVASIDPVNKTTTLLSIPRDLWVEMPTQYFGSHQKINAVYSAGKYRYYQQHGKSDEKAALKAGLDAVDTVLGQVLGVPIHYHAVVDFAAFKQAVDAVGGINVDVKTALVDPTMAWENGGNATLAKAGVQQMDGTTALRYVRSRHTSSDFARSVRQREVLVALQKKVLTTSTLANPLKIQQLIATFGKNVFTDISTLDLVRLYGIASTIDESAITSLDLVTSEQPLVVTDRVGSTSIVRPKLGLNRYSDIQTYVRSHLSDGYLLKERAGVAVAASSQGAADGAKQVLKGLGYTVVSSQASPIAGVQKTTIVDMSNGLSPYSKYYLGKRFGNNFTEILPKGLVVPDGTQFVILVGE